MTIEVKKETLHLDTVYGTLAVDDLLVKEIIESAPFQRLKEINQYGVVNFIVPTENYTRFDHSLGVYYLLKKHNCPREEQIAGLLHDVSHTAFSHVGDYVFKQTYPGHSYQDDIHIWYLKESGLGELLEKHGLSSEALDNKNPAFKALDRPLPELCADRIEYNLQGALLRGLMTRREFHQIVQALEYKEDQWVIHCPDAAKKLGYCSLVMTETLWGAAWEVLAYQYTAEALHRSFAIGLITFQEFHFSTDQLVWNKLITSEDPIIAEKIYLIKNVHSTFHLSPHGEEDLLLKLKFRGINPVIATPEGNFPLTALDSHYQKEFKRVQEVLEKGWPIRFVSH